LHIGTAKTGTTSLQDFLAMNRSVLTNKGILYPRTFGKRNHAKIIDYVLDFHKVDYLKKLFGKLLIKKFKRAGLLSRSSVLMGLTSKDRVEDFRKEILSSFQKEIQNTNCTKLLISTEGFASFYSVKDIRFLKKFLDDFVNEYTIIVYLRSQHERAISEFTTHLRSGRRTPIIFRKRFHQHFNYEELLGDWGNVFGDKNIVPRIFSRKELLDGDIKKDFVSLLGLNWNDFEDVECRNNSMSVEAQ